MKSNLQPPQPPPSASGSTPGFQPEPAQIGSPMCWCGDLLSYCQAQSRRRAAARAARRGGRS